jgi:hypothetical protein
MPQYRIYRVNERGYATPPPQIIEATDYAHAIAQATLMAQEECDLEVWDEARRVGVIERRR